MISAWWLLFALVVGAITGFFLLALVSGNKDDDDKK